jgi:hypothetical protein
MMKLIAYPIITIGLVFAVIFITLLLVDWINLLFIGVKGSWANWISRAIGGPGITYFLWVQITPFNERAFGATIILGYVAIPHLLSAWISMREEAGSPLPKIAEWYQFAFGIGAVGLALYSLSQSLSGNSYMGLWLTAGAVLLVIVALKADEINKAAAKGPLVQLTPNNNLPAASPSPRVIEAQPLRSSWTPGYVIDDFDVPPQRGG